MQQEFVFSVLACHRAHVYLSTGDVNSPLYNIAIGDDKNRQSTIRDKNNSPVLVANTPGILDCQEERDFWLSWTDQTIRVGEGSDSGNMFLEYYMPDYVPITEVSVVTEDYATGVWDFKAQNGEASVCLLHCACTK